MRFRWWLILCFLLLPGHVLAQSQRVTLWHAYRDDEQAALTRVLQRARTELGLEIDTLPVPFNAYASKLESSIPFDQGPDLFIGPHDWLQGFRTRSMIAPAEVSGDEVRSLTEEGGVYEPVALRALRFEGQAWAWPLALKCVALYVNPDFVPQRIETLEALEGLRSSLPRDVFAFAYNAQNAYYHAPLAHAYGAGLLDEQGRYLFVGDGAARSIAHAQRMARSRAVPDEADGALVEQLFLARRAATAMGDSSLAARLGTRVPYRVEPLPMVQATGRALEPFATIEGLYLSGRARNPEGARRLARFLAGVEGARERAVTGRQVVASLRAWDDPQIANDRLLTAFRAAAQRARPMPGHPFLRYVFVPAERALRKALRGETSIETALAEGERRFRTSTRPLPPRGNPVWALLALGVVALGLVFRALQRVREPGFRQEFRKSLPAYAYVSQAAITVFLLVVAPLFFGAITSLYAGREGQLYYAGLANYLDILAAQGAGLLSSGSFYVVLLITVLWTIANLSLHLGIGVALALLLSRPKMRFKGLWRVLLIVPWAVPSYVTALAWKGLFHRQLGAVNAVLGVFGIEPVAWFARFSTAFCANLATNVWLGFPFMMVVTLGALTAIPGELYEAAELDGAGWWDQFRHITLPLLKPSLGPAVALGAVWTFNQFNVIYLVSGGEPDGQTEILVTEAYRWAFTRQAQYGYAAAYAVLIFGVLTVGTRFLNALTAPPKTSERTEGH